MQMNGRVYVALAHVVHPNLLTGFTSFELTEINLLSRGILISIICLGPVWPHSEEGDIVCMRVFMLVPVWNLSHQIPFTRTYNDDVISSSNALNSWLIYQNKTNQKWKQNCP